MNYLIHFIAAILLTTLSYFAGSYVTGGIAFWHALIIGTTVVSLGAVTEWLGAPVWLIVITPFPVGMILLFLFLKQPLGAWFVTYLTILGLYTIIHMIASYFFEFHSLIPAWKLA